jgi:mannose-6-phosphate isomerase
MNLANRVRSERPWGSFEQFTLNEPSTVKLIEVKAGQRLSYQSHQNRDEFWRCIKGPLKAVVDDQEVVMNEGDEVFVSAGTKHRLVGDQADGLCLEISFGVFDEGDIVRHQDDYSRN